MSGIKDYKITDTTGYKVEDVPGDTLSGTVAQNKAVFDRLASLVITKFNAALDYLYAKGIDAGAGGTDNIYPVGSVYLTVTNVNPTTLFGGTWVQIKDRFLLAAGDTYAAGATGGSADMIVPNHNHYVSAKTLTCTLNTTDVAAGSGSQTVKNIDPDGAGTQVFTGETTSFYTDSTGQSATGANMPPYLAVYAWRRTA